MIDRLRILTKSNDTSTLEILIDQCKRIAVDYCHLDEYAEKLDTVVQMMVCERFNKLYSEGVNTKSYSGLQESYTDDFSPSIYKQLKRFRKLRAR